MQLLDIIFTFSTTYDIVCALHAALRRTCENNVKEGYSESAFLMAFQLKLTSEFSFSPNLTLYPIHDTISVNYKVHTSMPRIYEYPDDVEMYMCSHNQCFSS